MKKSEDLFAGLQKITTFALSNSDTEPYGDG
jgi:hypothetical protein